MSAHPTPLVTPLTDPESGLDGERCVVLSAVMRRGLCTYDLPENEQRLAHWLLLQSYDVGELTGRVDLEAWSRELGFVDGKGLRPDKARAVLESLEKLRIVNWHRGGLEGAQPGPQGVFELLPHQADWSRLRRVRSLGQDTGAGTGELRLSSEAPLDRALAGNSREKTASGPDSAGPGGRPRSRNWPALWRRLREALGNPENVGGLLQELSSEKSAETSAESADRVVGGKIRRHDPPENIGGNASAEKSAETPIASLAPVQRAKLAIASAESAEPGEALAYLASVDRRGTLRGRFRSEYERLCERAAAYVLGRLRRAFEEHERHYRQKNPGYQLPDPVGWMGRKAADEGKMAWHGRRQQWGRPDR